MFAVPPPSLLGLVREALPVLGALDQIPHPGLRIISRTVLTSVPLALNDPGGSGWISPWYSSTQRRNAVVLRSWRKVTPADMTDARRPPGFTNAQGTVYWLGTDGQGRDVLSAILYGLRISIDAPSSRVTS